MGSRNRLFGSLKILFLSVALNILIVTAAVAVVHLIFHYFGIPTDQYPLTYLFVFYSVIGMGGAFISLALSRVIAKRVFKVRLIESQSASQQELALLNQVQRLSKKAYLPEVPEFGVFESPEVNAFATGPSRKRSLVAVSSALLQTMDEEEVEGVLAHEIAHIANGDMVTMTILQGIVNTMVLFLARILTMIVTSRMQRRSWFLEFSIFMLFQVVLNILGSVLVLNVFSRWREYRADKGAARLAGSSKILKALKKLQAIVPQMRLDRTTAQYNNFKIATPEKRASFIRLLFSTHPPLASRIRRIERSTITSYS